MKNKKGIIGIGLVAGIIGALSVLFPKVGIIYEMICAFILCIFLVAAIFLVIKTQKKNKKELVENITIWKNQQIRMNKITPLAIILFVSAILLIPFWICSDFIPFISDFKYIDLIIIISIIYFFGLTAYFFYLFFKIDIKFISINNNKEEKDKWIKEYEDYLLNKAIEFFKSKDDKIQVVCKVNYYLKGKYQKQRVQVEEGYYSTLDIEFYSGNHLLNKEQLELINVNQKMFKHNFFSICYLTEKAFIDDLNAVIDYMFGDNFKYYKKSEDFIKELKFDVVKTLEYYSLFSKELNDSLYYNYYFELMKQERYEKLNKFLLSCGIDYTKMFYLSCSLENDNTITYNVVYRCYIDNINCRDLQTTIDDTEIVVSQEDDYSNIVLIINCDNEIEKIS